MSRLGVDLGTSNTVAVLDVAGRPIRPLLFDGSPQLPSAVFADPSGALLTGRDAVHHARTHPERFAPHPKRHVDEQAVLLGDAEPAVAELIAAILRRVREEAVRVAGRDIAEVVLTCPASWGPRRRGVLTAAAHLAGLPAPALVAEPVAAAFSFADLPGARTAVGTCVVVYDFGAGTFDASVVRRTPAGFEVLAGVGLADAGGLDLDEVIVSHLLAGHAEWDPALRGRLDRPADAGDRRARMLFWEDVRSAKEMLSRTAGTFIHVPLLDVDVPLGRDQFEQLARPILDRTVTATRAALGDAGVTMTDVNGMFLVGGASRIPLVATMLHRAFGIAPTVIEQPELVVAQGALRVPRGVAASVPVTPPADPFRQPAPTPVFARPAPLAPTQTMPAVVTDDEDPAEDGPAAMVRPARPVRTVVVASVLALLLAVAVGAAYAGRSWFDRKRAVDTSRSPEPPGAGAPAPSGTFPAGVVGRWGGQMLQSDGKTLAVEVQIGAGSPVATVAYPELKCAGTLTLTGDIGGTMAVREGITSGSCTPRGSISLTLTPGGLSFLYRPDNDTYSASGFLKRR